MSSFFSEQQFVPYECYGEAGWTDWATFRLLGDFFLLWAFLKYRHGTIFLANFRLLGEWLFTLGIFKYRYGTIFIANFRQLGDWLFTLKIF
jgi:hypothetical protein